MITEDQLIEDLRKLGYCVKKRRLTDWRANELLPELSSKGQGKGRGKLYFWSQPDILRHAITVYELLEWHTRFNEIYLPLWLLGFPAPLDTVRKKLIEWYDSNIKPMSAIGAGDIETVADNVAMQNLGWSDMPGVEGQHKILSASAFPVEAIIKAFSDPSYKLTNNNLNEIMGELAGAAVHTQRYAPNSGIQQVFHGKPEWMQICVQFIQQHCRPPEVYKLLSDVSDEELLHSHTDLRLLVNFIRNAMKIIGHEELWNSIHLKAVTALAPWLVLADLWFRHNGYSERVNHLICELIDISQKLMIDIELRCKQASIALEHNGESES